MSSDRDFQESLTIGQAAEAATMRAFVEMGGAVIKTDSYDDHNGLDIHIIRPVPKWVKEQKKKVSYEMLFLQVKSTAHPTTVKECLRGSYNSFMVEWRSGSNNRATSFSDEDSPVTHYVYACRLGEKNGRMPFMLVSVRDLRQFFLQHKDDPSFVKVWRDHAYNLDMAAFKKEYGFVHYHWNGKEWKPETYGKEIKPFCVWDGICGAELVTAIRKGQAELINAHPDNNRVFYERMRVQDKTEHIKAAWLGDLEKRVYDKTHPKQYNKKYAPTEYQEAEGD